MRYTFYVFLLAVVVLHAADCGYLKSPSEAGGAGENRPLLVDVHATTVHEINGITAVTKVFGLTLVQCIILYVCMWCEGSSNF